MTMQWQAQRTRVGWWAAVTLWLVAAAAQAAGLSATPVAPNVYAFIGDLGARTAENGGMNANAGFVITDDGVVVIDSGAGNHIARQMDEAISQITTQPVRYVINTGGQDHRWLGNGYFKARGATLIGHRRLLDDLAARGEAQRQAMAAVVGAPMAGTELVPPDAVFDDRYDLRLGGVEIQVLRFQGGHTPGDVVVWLPQSGVLFAGDLVYVDRLLGVIPVSVARDWLASFQAMEQLAPKTIVPGHGQVCDLPKAQRETRDYLALLVTEIRKRIDAGDDLQTTVDTLDQSAFAHLANYDELERMNANRVYLELEREL